MTSWGRRQKNVIFLRVFFRNHENSQAKNPVNGKQTFLKKYIFWRFFEKSDRTKFFFGNGLIEPKNWERLPIGLLTSLIKRKNVIFPPKPSFLAKKSACGKPPAEENCPFPRETLFGPKKKRLRQAASQKMSKMQIFLQKKQQKNTKMNDWKKCHNSNVLLSILDKKIASGSSRRDLSF